MRQNNGRFAKGTSGNPNGRPTNNDFVNTRDYKLFKKYGIRLANYDALLEKQGGVCAICGQPETKMQARKTGGAKTIDSLQVDHDHVTGIVRGLLCWKCNVGVVKFLEDKELASKAATYLGIRLEYSGR